MNRPIPIAIAFGLCLTVVLAALGWTSLHLLRFDAAQRQAQSQATLEENVRLALWRMDSALAGLAAQESVRPVAEYQPVYYLGRNSVSLTPSGDSQRVSSPLAIATVPYIVAHFQVGDDGRLISPQFTDDEAEPRQQQVRVLARIIADSKLAERLPAPTAPAEIEAPPMADIAQSAGDMPSQQARGAIEYQRRSQYVLNNSIVTQNASQLPSVPLASTGLAGGVMTPVWFNGRLLLARRVLLAEQGYLQICWLDWPAIEVWLTDLIRDLLPAAHLAAAPTDSEEQPTRRLAALPLVLNPGEASSTVGEWWSPLRWSLAIAWLCVVLAAVAVGTLLTGVVSLSERRAAFVSAVTHELRTPLTTLRMYAEMLAEGMVGDDAQRTTYLNTLRIEAERLAHLVENVLAYARLERGRSPATWQTIRVDELLDRMSDRLSERCRQAEMQLLIEAGDEVRGRTLRTDPSSVEQIVFNLVDNACKYAGRAADHRIHLSAAADQTHVRLAVADHGPGITPSVARRLFRPFGKSAEEAARSAAGVGLGLALCRRLSRQLNATLKLESNHSGGACFALLLPVV
jgi:signal transduction histidine kinase